MSDDVIRQAQTKAYGIFLNMLRTAIKDLSRRECTECMKTFLDQMVSNKTISEYNIYGDYVTFHIHEFYVASLSEKEERIDI